MTATTSPYGQWQSPISAALVAESEGRPMWPGVHRGRVLFTSPVPAEGGRVGLFAATDGGAVTEVVGAPWNVRNRVHEYGGKPWTSVGDVCVFTNWDDQRLYALDLADPAARPRPLTPEPARHHGLRYADLCPGPGDTVWCVRETVTGDAPTDIAHDVVAVPLTGGEPAPVLAGRQHFLACARPSPDGQRVAWIGWDHPAMPWHGTELCVAELDTDGTTAEHRVLAGGPREAVCQLEWENDGHLLALTDPDGWWNLHRVGLDGTAVNLAPAAVECGGPMWQVGASWFAPLGDQRYAVLCAGRPAVLDARAGTVTDIPGLDDVPRFAHGIATDGATLYGSAAGPLRKAALVAVDTGRGGYTALTPQPEGLPDPAYLPVPQRREVTDAAGNRIPAFVYPPTNPEHVAPDGELPPYLVHVHGGPTGAVAPVLDLDFAYFTSRGIGVVAVNYGGSTGNGRAYRERLDGRWGVVDIADCATVADALAAEGTADPDRLAIRGGSAGGYTAALAIATTSTYRAATVLFPVIDLLRFAQGDTHDMESQYTYSLVGALPEHAERYRERSPITHASRVRGPVLLLQGNEDAICPPEQATSFIEALDGSGVPHAYLRFDGEQHGFRKASTLVAAAEAELAFYGRVLGFTPHDALPPLDLAR